MENYFLTEWEHNGYHDSDFFVAYWDDEKGKIVVNEYATTRGYGSCGVTPDMCIHGIPEDVRGRIEGYVAPILMEQMKEKDRRAIDEPENAMNGERLVIMKDGIFRDKRSGVDVEYHSGDVGVVFWCGTFGKFYRNGYNHPGRENRRVGLDVGGKKVFVPLKFCKKSQEYATEQDLTFKVKERMASGAYILDFVTRPFRR